MLDISVIIPCYNAEPKLLKKCLKSILTQKNANFEVILVDDGSLEPFCTEIERLAADDDRIRLIRQENAGVSTARNNGAIAANGEYIIFVDADDVLMSGFFEEALTTAKKNNADLVVGCNINLKYVSQLKQSAKISDSDITVYKDNKNLLKPLMVGRIKYFNDKWYIGRGPWCRLIRADLVKSIPFDKNLKIGEDILWNLHLIKHAETICVAKRVWYGYYTGGSSATRGYDSKIIEKLETELSKFRSELDLSNDEELRAFCDRIMEDLEAVANRYICHDNCSIDRKNRNKLKRQLYTSEPWILCKNPRYLKMTDKKNRFKVIMYRLRLFFLYYSLK